VNLVFFINKNSDMNQKASNINTLITVLNVFKRISDKAYIQIAWNGGYYNPLFLDCEEAIEVLNDVCLFDFIHNRYPTGWEDTFLMLNPALVAEIIHLVKKIDAFEGRNLPLGKLLLDEHWIEIMTLAKPVSDALEKALGLEEIDYLY
jgi:hypothetical protein